MVPPESDLGAPPEERVCEDALADLRFENEDLRPTPSDEVEERVDRWGKVAGSAFFECPSEGSEIGSFADAYTELANIAASVDEALNLD